MSRAKSMFKVTTEIRAIILGDPKVTALVGDNIFPIIARKVPTGDFILYEREEYSIKRTKMGICQQKCMVYVNCISEDYDRSLELACLIFESLEGEFSDPDMTIRFEDSTEEFGDGKYIQTLLFSIE